MLPRSQHSTWRRVHSITFVKTFRLIPLWMIAPLTSLLAHNWPSRLKNTSLINCDDIVVTLCHKHEVPDCTLRNLCCLTFHLGAFPFFLSAVLDRYYLLYGYHTSPISLEHASNFHNYFPYSQVYIWTQICDYSQYRTLLTLIRIVSCFLSLKIESFNKIRKSIQLSLI